jgi:hypothetical protein
MPTFEPPIRPDEIAVEPLDIIGFAERGRLSHIGFAWEAAEVSRDNEVAIVDARPVRRDSDKLPVHVIGRLRLSARERKLVATWLQRRLRARTLAGNFIRVSDGQRDIVSRRVVGHRDSCASLVHQCLHSCTGVELVKLDALPACERDRLVELWGERVVEMAVYHDELDGSGPWQVLLPAHILHALARAEPRLEPFEPAPRHWDYGTKKS